MFNVGRNKGMAGTARPKGQKPARHHRMLCTKVALLACHVSLVNAGSCQDGHRRCTANFRKSSSQRNQCVLPGLRERNAEGSLDSAAHHTESRHSSPRFASLASLILMTCPAQHHLLCKCVSSHIRTPACCARERAAQVDLCIQSTHVSSGFRLGPAIFLSILF